MAADSADPGADPGSKTGADAGTPAGAEPQPKPDAQPGLKTKTKAHKRPGSHPAGKRSAANAARRRARELALQGLYQWLLSGEAAGVIDAHMREQEDFAAADSAHFDALLHGCIAEAAALDAALARHTDRRTSLLSPVEHAALLIGSYELMHCLDVPYRVVINEAVELAKSFGGTDGHKFVNGVMDKVATDLRAEEAAAWRATR